jgi:hypothetical protein
MAVLRSGVGLGRLEVSRLADPAVSLRPTARRVLRALRDDGPQCSDQLAARLRKPGGRPIRPPTVVGALGELPAAGLAAVAIRGLPGEGGRRPPAGRP